MTTSSDILDRGYFPEELPPPFYTSDFAKKVIAGAAALPATFINPHPVYGKSTTHNLMRVGKLRRLLSLPNPIFYYGLSREFEQNWNAISAHCLRSSFSRSIPVVGPSAGRSIITQYGIKDLLPYRASIRSRSRFILKADIARFYPSVYTHSICWSLHTKITAKKNKRNKRFLGNRLDEWTRNGQDGQTIGIPIGPDTSLAIAEIILSDVDMRLTQLLPKINGFRYVDDYEIGTKTHSEAEEILAILQDSLRAYELELGAQKTMILELPQRLESPWVAQLRNFSFRSKGQGQFSDLTQYFDLALKFAEENPKDSVLNYAISRFRNFNCDPGNWNFLQDMLFHCLMVEPSVVIKVFSIFFNYKNKGANIDLLKLDDVLNYQIIYHGSLGHGSEVAWAIWSMMTFGVPMNSDAAKIVSRMDDSVVALIALDAEQLNLVPSGLDKTLWTSYMTTDELYGEHWLLSYEANVKNWLPSIGVIDHVAADPNFHYLKNMGVEFYNRLRGLSMSPTFVSPSLQTAPLFSLGRS